MLLYLLRLTNLSARLPLGLEPYRVVNTFSQLTKNEATAVIEAVRKWSHILARQHLTLVTHRKSVAFVFDSRSSVNDNRRSDETLTEKKNEPESGAPS